MEPLKGRKHELGVDELGVDELGELQCKMAPTRGVAAPTTSPDLLPSAERRASHPCGASGARAGARTP